MIYLKRCLLMVMLISCSLFSLLSQNQRFPALSSHRLTFPESAGIPNSDVSVFKHKDHIVQILYNEYYIVVMTKLMDKGKLEGISTFKLQKKKKEKKGYGYPKYELYLEVLMTDNKIYFPAGKKGDMVLRKDGYYHEAEFYYEVDLEKLTKKNKGELVSKIVDNKYLKSLDFTIKKLDHVTHVKPIKYTSNLMSYVYTIKKRSALGRYCDITSEVFKTPPAFRRH